ELRSLVTEHICGLQQGPLLCARYNLKPAIRKLGPAGHLFEQYVAELFRADGFSDVKVGEVIQGECATHEIDIIATKEEKHHMVECKFHNREGTKSDVTVALYVYARFLDVQNASPQNSGFQAAWLATNTKLTTDAEHYAKCKDMQILTMELPYGSSIIDRVVSQGLFPISSLEILDPYLPNLFEAEKLMLKDVPQMTTSEASSLSIPEDVFAKAQAQATAILS
ncbi:restriction endonuclease, partial [Candidatus Dojkabacteria bacterium]|nr:restriction endonuclease [Candidatus Dojkabacteria bacterium]